MLQVEGQLREVYLQASGLRVFTVGWGLGFRVGCGLGFRVG